MKTLIIKLAAPLQSYGNEATFNRRTSYRYPSKSAVLGMIAAALGYRRNNTKNITALNQLQMAVRIDQPGETLTDFQIIEYDRKKQKRSLSYRDYLQDAVFVVAISGRDNQIDQIDDALHHPIFQLFLGRRANVPAGPLITKLFDNHDPITVLKNYEWQASTWYQHRLKEANYSTEIIADSKLASSNVKMMTRDEIGSFDQNHRWHSYRSITSIPVILKNKNYKEHDIMAEL